MWQAERRLGGRWCHLLISWRPIRQQKGPCRCFCLDLSTHLPSLLTALSNKWRCKKKRTNRVQIWFSSIGNRAFSVQWVIARGPLPFDVRHRNDTNCISPLWNTISGRRDGEHIHLLAWSFKRRAPVLIWRGSSASFFDKNQKGEKHRQRRRWLCVSDSKWSDLRTRWSHQDVDELRKQDWGNRMIYVFLIVIYRQAFLLEHHWHHCSFYSVCLNLFGFSL